MERVTYAGALNSRDGSSFRRDEPCTEVGGEYDFDRVRAEVSTGMQRPVNVVLFVQDGGFFGVDRLEKFVEFQWRHSAHFSLAAVLQENDVALPSGSFKSHLATATLNAIVTPRLIRRQDLSIRQPQHP